MHAYLNDPERKAQVFALLTGTYGRLPHATLPWDVDAGDLDYEHELGIPTPVALIAHTVWTHTTGRYRQDWPASFFRAIDVGDDLRGVVTEWLHWLFEAYPLLTGEGLHGWNPASWEQMGDHLLLCLARAPAADGG